MTRIEPDRTRLPRALCGSPVEDWPPPPIPGSARLMPIDSWAAMWEEARATGVELDAYWLDNVEAGVAYYFRWMGEPRATVLVIWGGAEVLHVECRGTGDRKLPASESLEIQEEVQRLFAEEGFKAMAEGNA
jgi:hypothetical protein